jgi:hypothetical protein
MQTMLKMINRKLIEIWGDVDGKRTTCICLISERAGKYWLHRTSYWEQCSILLWNYGKYWDTGWYSFILHMKLLLITSWTLLAMYRDRESRSVPVRINSVIRTSGAPLINLVMSSLVVECISTVKMVSFNACMLCLLEKHLWFCESFHRCL